MYQQNDEHQINTLIKWNIDYRCECIVSHNI